MRDFADKMFFAGGLVLAAVIAVATVLYRPAAGYTLLHFSLVVLILTAFAARYFGAGIGGLVGVVSTIAIAVAMQGSDMSVSTDGGLQFSAAILALMALGVAGFVAYLGRATEYARSAERDVAAVAHLGVGFVPQRFDEETVGEFLIAVAAMTGAREARAAVERDGEVWLIPPQDDLDPEWADRQRVAELVLEGARATSTEAETRDAGFVTSLADIYIPTASSSGVDGVLIAVPARGRGVWTDSETGTLRFAAELLGALIERERFHRQALRLEAMREAETLKSSILLSVSHDVKTPLAAANATVSKLLDEARERGDEGLAEDLAETVDDLQTLNSRINELIDLSRLETAS